MPIKITLSNIYKRKNNDCSCFEQTHIELRSNEEYSAIEILFDDTIISIPVPKFISVITALVEEREIDNVKKQITSLQDKQIGLERQIKTLKDHTLPTF